MSDLLTEEQMRVALFGPSVPDEVRTVDASELQFVPTKRATSKPALKQSTKPSLFPKVRVTMRVTKVFEGEGEILVHDARTLSTLVAEQEARAVAKKKKFQYVEIVSATQI